MKRIAGVVVLIVIVVAANRLGLEIPQSSDSADPTAAAVTRAFTERLDDLVLTDEGRVVKVLSDDLKGSRHQRFLVAVGDGTTVLIAHNIDLAPRVPNLREGDLVRFRGEYEWNQKGGVVHWTHRDPDGRHVGGWLQHRGERYQ